MQCWVFGECEKQKVNASLLSLPFPLQESNELVTAASTCRHRKGGRCTLHTTPTVAELPAKTTASLVKWATRYSSNWDFNKNLM